MCEYDPYCPCGNDYEAENVIKPKVKVLVWKRNPGDSIWYRTAEAIILAETESSYKVKCGVFKTEWLSKNGTYQKCEVIKE